MTLSFTTSKRLDLFLVTIRSLSSQCLDLYMVDRILLIDDNSSTPDLEMMQLEVKALFGEMEVEVCTSSKVRGHAKGMQLWYDKIKGSHVFHCEDDWEFVGPGCPILAAIDVLSNNPEIGQVAFSRESPLAEVQYTPTGTAYWIWEYDRSPICIPGIHATWPCFTLNPSIIKVAALRKVGNFLDRMNFEYCYGQGWVKAGLKTAYLKRMFTRHIGENRSAYQINGTSR
jgi:hypothetical protein